jgi:hypothetical protein
VSSVKPLTPTITAVPSSIARCALYADS